MNIYKLFLFVSLSFVSVFADAHSVQVQYCVNCNGDLRLWVEHWHGAEDPSSTTMTISLDVGGTVTTQTSAPGGGVQNVTPGNLPGCSTPITYATGCPGDQNTYNDWVYYDFTGIPQNVPITFTILSGNTVFTEDGCNMYPLSVNFTIAGVGQIDNQDVCSGEVTSSINLPATATWTNDNPGIGIPASGTGPITAFTPVGPVGTVANIDYANECGTGTFAYTIQPAPTPGSTSSSGGVNSTESCLGTPFNFVDNSSVPAPYVIDGWLWDFGDGNTSTEQNPDYTYAAPGDYTVTFTAESDIGCGSSMTFPVTVNSIPVASFINDIVCANTATTFDDQSTVANSTITGWTWDILDDNSTDYTVENPTHTFTAGGTYDVSLIVQAATGCSSPEVIQTVDVDYIPVPDFTSDSVCIGLATTLTDASAVTNGTITGWTWQFGDGNTGTGTPATNTYPNTGDFTATLEVTSSNGCTSSTTGNVYVRALPVADFSITDACFYNDVTTTNNSSIGNGTMTYSWDFGDASALDVNTAPNHSYASAGVYNVNLTATSNFGCVHSITHPVNIYDKPIADFSVQTVCLDENSDFNDNSSIPNVINGDVISEWDWDINDDNSFEYNTQNPQHLFLSEGGFNTTLIATTAFGCKDTVNLPIDVWPLPEVDFDFVDLCLNDITNFSDLSTVSNTYTVNTNNTFTWDFGDGISGSGTNPTHIYSNHGDFNVNLSVTSNNGCENDFTQVLNIRPLPAPEFASTTICINTPPTSFTNSTTIPVGTISQLDWDFGDGTTGTGQAPTNTYPNSGIFNTTLTATSAFGCVNSITHPVIVYEKPTAMFTSDETQACAPGTIEFTDLSYSNTTSIDAWQWNLFNGSTPDSQNPTGSYTNETEDVTFFDVELIATNSFGCSDTILVDNYISIIPQPEAIFSFSPSLLTINESETQFSNQSINADEYSWNFGDNSGQSNEFEPNHEYPDIPESYIVELIAYNYGQFCSDTAYATVQVEDILLFHVPNVFTPDNDDYNEVWHPIFVAGYDPYDFHVILFNRYGEKVWESYDASAGWDGHYTGRGGLVADGVYIWTIEFKETMSDKRHRHTGHVTVLQ